MDWAVKHRPKTLDEIVGQETNITILKSKLTDPFQTMIFYGTSGCGKTTTARAFATAINAETIEINGANHNSVNNAREIIDIAGKMSLSGKPKVFVIDECHRLSKEAIDALLTITEQPPKSVIFIFCTTEYKALPFHKASRGWVKVIDALNELWGLYDHPKQSAKEYPQVLFVDSFDEVGKNT